MADMRSSLGLIGNDGEERCHLGILQSSPAYKRKGADGIKELEFKKEYKIKTTIPLNYELTKPVEIDILKTFLSENTISTIIEKKHNTNMNMKLSIGLTLPEVYYQISMRAMKAFEYLHDSKIEVIDSNTLKEMVDINNIVKMLDGLRGAS